MATTTVDDPVREEVERVLHLMVDASLLVPRAAVSAATAVPRCVVRRACRFTRRLGEPLRVARSFFDMAGVGGANDASPSEDLLARERVVGVDVEAEPVEATDLGSDEAVTLPIEEYESLAASQVVARLASLRPDELAVVRDFEAAHRGRRTILGKIDQLLA